MKLGLVGCGSIARIIASNVDVQAAYDMNPERAEGFAREFGVATFTDFQDFLRQNFDIAVECASQKAVRDYAIGILESGRDVVILSSGALMDDEFRQKLIDAAERTGKRVYIPSGAISVDAIASASIMGFREVRLRTTKRNVKRFSGKASQAVKLFPRQINVAATLSLAAQRDVDVEMLPGSSAENIHEIFASGEFGEIYIRVKNRPSEQNPKTSVIAALSVVRLLKILNSRLVVL